MTTPYSERQQITEAIALLERRVEHQARFIDQQIALLTLQQQWARHLTEQGVLSCANAASVPISN